ncbi:hypothetical protein Xph01_15100 [Micromonospora phaseoli]|nr:hypothetical protein Xph01_15100 [Micromonospora phaseoli]
MLATLARSGDRTWWLTRQVLREGPVIRNPGDSQRAPEGTSPRCLREAGRIWMQVRSPTRQTAGRIDSEAQTSPVADRDDPQQFTGRHAPSATHTGAFRQRASYHWWKSTPSYPTPLRPVPGRDQRRAGRW